MTKQPEVEVAHPRSKLPLRCQNWKHNNPVLLHFHFNDLCIVFRYKNFTCLMCIFLFELFFHLFLSSVISACTTCLYFCLSFLFFFPFVFCCWCLYPHISGLCITVDVWHPNCEGIMFRARVIVSMVARPVRPPCHRMSVCEWECKRSIWRYMKTLKVVVHTFFYFKNITHFR